MFTRCIFQRLPNTTVTTVRLEWHLWFSAKSRERDGQTIPLCNGQTRVNSATVIQDSQFRRSEQESRVRRSAKGRKSDGQNSCICNGQHPVVVWAHLVPFVFNVTVFFGGWTVLRPKCIVWISATKHRNMFTFKPPRHGCSVVRVDTYANSNLAWLQVTRAIAIPGDVFTA